MTSVLREYDIPRMHAIGDTKMSVMPADHDCWLICDGRLLYKEPYMKLYNIIGDSFGSGTATMFRLPNAAGRVAAAIGNAGAGMNTWEMGHKAGEEQHTLTISEMPQHSHTNNSSDSLGLMKVTGSNTADTNVNPGSTEADLYVRPAALTIDPEGNSLPHNNIQPTIYIGNMFIYAGY
jgi:microcystin-dependent protein